MSTEPTERNEVEVKKGYNPEEVKTVVDVLDQRALMNIITSELPSYTGSKMLKLSKLGINKVETLSCLDHLNRLDLSYNKLKSVRALGNLGELTYLNLNCNILSGKGIRGILVLENLVFLNLGNNRISVIPDFAFAKMAKLNCLLLNHNKLEEITFVSILSELNTLVLSNNQIKSIPADAFKNLTKLRKLSLGHNQLTEFPPVFHLTYLKELNLNSNKISSIPDEITQLQHLVQLDIGNNLIENVQSLEIFSQMPVLVKLNVAQNTFYGLSSQAEGEVNVEVLEKTNQQISSMLPHLTTLNNRQLALGKEKKEIRKKHFEEKSKGKMNKSSKVGEKGTEGEEKKEVAPRKGVQSKNVRSAKSAKSAKSTKSAKLAKLAKPAKFEKPEKKPEEKPEEKPEKPEEKPEKPEEKPEEKPTQAMEEEPEPDIKQSGVLEVENVQHVQSAKANAEDVANFLLGSNDKEELDGWD